MIKEDQLLDYLSKIEQESTLNSKRYKARMEKMRNDMEEK